MYRMAMCLTGGTGCVLGTAVGALSKKISQLELLEWHCFVGISFRKQNETERERERGGGRENGTMFIECLW